MRPRHIFLKIARLRGTFVETVGSGRSALSFISFCSPLRNRYTFRPPTGNRKGENDKQQFPWRQFSIGILQCSQ
jgi:hypothetical protein